MSAHMLCWTAGAAAGFVAGILVLRARGAVTWATVLALGLAWEGLLLGAKWHFRLELHPLADALQMAVASRAAEVGGISILTISLARPERESG